MTHPKRDSRIHRPYCLRCYLPLERQSDARQVCSRCGYVNVKVDQGKYWTREAWLCRIEWLAKAAISLLIAWISWKILFAGQAGTGMGHGIAVGFPILLGVVLWDTASKITRRQPYFRATIVWSVVIAVLGVLPTLVGVFASDLPPMARTVILTVGLGFFGIAAAIPLLGRAYGRWQVRRILIRAAE